MAQVESRMRFCYSDTHRVCFCREDLKYIFIRLIVANGKDEIVFGLG